MDKTLLVAWREFTSTVGTRGFFIGVVIFPLIMVVGFALVPALITNQPPPVRGRVAVIDPTGRLAGEIERGILERAAESGGPEGAIARAQQLASGVQGNGATAGQALEIAQGVVAGASAPELRVEVLPDDTDVETVKAELYATKADASRAMLAVVQLDPNALTADADGQYGAYRVYVRAKLDARIDRQVIRPAVNRAITDARQRDIGLDPERVRKLTAVVAPQAQVVTAGGERDSSGAAQILLPLGMLMLLWIASFTGGQYLLTTTIEEKSNRVMEVLLSSVSPLQLMVGKIVGQMGVGLLVLTLYGAMGVVGLVSFSLGDELSTSELGLLLAYFLIAYFLIASMMAAVGSAVSEVHEAQSLIGPIMLVVMLPMIFSTAIITNPNGTLAAVASFVPPFSPFVMVLRVGAAEPVPGWQVAGSIAVGLASVCVASWAAAKVFRIGVLMYGKPPNFWTLLRWVRMA